MFVGRLSVTVIIVNDQYNSLSCVRQHGLMYELICSTRQPGNVDVQPRLHAQPGEVGCLRRQQRRQRQDRPSGKYVWGRIQAKRRPLSTKATRSL